MPPVTDSARVSNATASVEAIRNQFPALYRRQAGQPVAYFDGPGGTQVPQQVVTAMVEYLLNHNANTHWNYPTSAETDRIIADARQALADFLNASPSEIVFGANMTTLTFHLGRALSRSWGPGDEILVTELDHHANVDPWKALERERGVTVRTIRMNPGNGTLDWGDLTAGLSNRTKLLAIGAASNALGTVTDVREAGTLAHAAGSLVFVDAVHYAPHALVDVQKIDCDFLACSAYKFYGPHIGVLYGRRSLLESLDVPKLVPAPDEAPDRLETGTQNHEGIAGAAAAVNFLAGLGAPGDRRQALGQVFATLHERGRDLVGEIWNSLGAIDGVTLYGPAPDAPRTPTVSFAIAGHRSDNVATELARRGIFVSHGDFYATTLVERIGRQADGVVRVGCACYTTAEEVHRLVDAIREIARR